MKKYPNLTLKRVQRKHRDNPKDKKLHEVIEQGTVGKKEFLGFISKAIKS